MKTQEITDNDLKQMFTKIIEQAPLLTENQVNEFLNNFPEAKNGNAVKRFFQNQLNKLLFSTAIILMIVSAVIIWENLHDKTEELAEQNNPLEEIIPPISSDSATAETSIIFAKEMEQKTAAEDSVLKAHPIKSNPTVAPTKLVTLSDVYKHFEKKPQIFSIRTGSDTSITCKEGTIIKIGANTFVSKNTGDEITGTVQVEVKEYYKISDMVFANLTTTSGNRILETGGMLHISAKAGNEDCVIKPGRDIEIGYSYSEKKDDMELFYGESINNNIDWKPAKTTSEASRIIVQQEPEVNYEVFFIVEDMPEFPGGEKALKKYIEQNIQYPYSALKDSIQGKVYVKFVIDKDGSVRDINIVRGLDKILDKVAVYIISKLPRWKPGKQRGMPVRVSYTVPVTFLYPNRDLTSKEIEQAKEFEEKLKDFKWDAEANRIYKNNIDFDVFEKKVLNDSLKKSDISEVRRYFFSTTRFGWLNCDKFYKSDRPVINFFIKADDLDIVIINAISRRFRGLIPGRIQSGRINFKLPMGEPVIIVALKTNNNKIFLAVNETEVDNNSEMVLDFKPVTLDLLKKEIEKLNKLYK